MAVTGILATIPYIALQLAGLEAVLRTMGLNGSGLAGHAPLFVAFMVSALYTYRSGIRAPALIAFIKAALIYLVIVTAVIILPAQLGGWGAIFDAAEAKRSDGILLGADNQLHYVTLTIGSALALFLYPHALTGVLSAGSRDVIKRNMVALPAYSLMLGLFALLGYAAIAAGTEPIVNAATNQPASNTLVPMLFAERFPSWFAGIAFAAIGIGALVPAAIMSIAAGNLWSRNIYRAYLRRDTITPADLRKLFTGLTNLGEVTRGLGDLPAAHTHYKHAREIAQRRAHQHPTPEIRHDAELSEKHFADISRELGDPSTVNAGHQCECDPAQGPDGQRRTPEALRDAALNAEHHADAARERGDLPTARAHYQRAVDFRQQLADQFAADEAKQAKVASLALKFGAVALIVLMDPQYSINLQLIGTLVILQTLPIVAIALYTRWFHVWGLVTGWVAGLGWGLSMLYSIPDPTSGRQHFGGTAFELGTLSILGWEPFAGATTQVYPGFVALLGNLGIAAAVTIGLRQMRMLKNANGTDETNAADYYADVAPPRPKPLAG